MSNPSISGSSNPIIKEFVQLKNKKNLSDQDINKFSQNKNVSDKDIKALVTEIYKDKVVDGNEKKLISALVNNSSNKDKLISSIKTNETSINPANKDITNLFIQGLKSKDNKPTEEKKVPNKNNVEPTENNPTIEQKLDPEKIKKMKSNPFSYFRATNPDFIKYAKDDPRIKTNVPNIQLQGDAHLENVGAHKKVGGGYGFGFNDFDDSFKGSYKMDLGRLATSIRFMAKEKGITDESKIDALVDKFLNKYKSDLSKYQNNELDKSKEPDFSKADPPNLISKYLSKVNKKKDEYITEKAVDGKFTYATDPEKNNEVKGGFSKIPDSESELVNNITNSLKSSNVLTNLANQLHVDVKDLKIGEIARRQAGTASIGSDRYGVVITNTKTNKTIILDIKESGAPSGDPKSTDNSKRIREASKSFIGEDLDSYDFGEMKIDSKTSGNKTFSVKEYSSANSNVKTETEEDLNILVESVAQLFARAHANSEQGSKILAESEKMITDIKSFSKDIYNKQQSDYEKFKVNN